MKIGIGLPANIPGVSRDVVLDWARQADSGPFSSVSIIDRVVYPNWDPLIALAAAAAVTQRVRLMTTLLISPVRDAALLAKQAASIDVLSRGRLTLGLGVGRREDDYAAVSGRFHRRGRRFDQQLALMKRVCAGENPMDGVGPGPTYPAGGGPEAARAGGPCLARNPPLRAERGSQDLRALCKPDGWSAEGGSGSVTASYLTTTLTSRPGTSKRLSLTLAGQ